MRRKSWPLCDKNGRRVIRRGNLFWIVISVSFGSGNRFVGPVQAMVITTAIGGDDDGEEPGTTNAATEEEEWIQGTETIEWQ